MNSQRNSAGSLLLLLPQDRMSLAPYATKAAAGHRCWESKVAKGTVLEPRGAGVADARGRRAASPPGGWVVKAKMKWCLVCEKEKALFQFSAFFSARVRERRPAFCFGRRPARSNAKSREDPRRPANTREVPRSPAKSREVPRSPAKSLKVPQSPAPRSQAKSREFKLSPVKSCEVPRSPAKSS